MTTHTPTNAEPAADPRATARADRRWWLELGLILAMFFVAGGAPAPHVNETHYLTKAKHYWNPAYCPGDAFLDSADAHLAYYWTVGWLTLWLPLPAVAWVSRVAAWLLIAVGWMRLSRAMSAAPWFAAATALLWIVLMDTCDFAGEWVVGGLHGKGGAEAKCFAYGLVLLGLAEMVAGNWRRPWIWFGAAAAMHVLVGGWAVIGALGVWRAEPREQRAGLRTLLPGLFLGGMLALPGLLPALALDRDVSAAQADEAARIYVYERLPHHLAPTTLPTEDFVRRATRFGVLVAVMACLPLWLARQTRAGASSARWRLERAQRIMRFATIALLENCIGATIALSLAEQPLVAARWLRFYWFRQADVYVPAAVAICASCLVIDLLRRDRSWAKLAIAAAMLMCAVRLGDIVADRIANPSPPGLGRTADPAAWLTACAWIREHAPPDAMCLVPRHAQSFKWYAERADVVNWKDIPQDALGVIEWRRRCHEIYPTIPGPEGPMVLNSPEQWGPARTLEIARRYGADYVVARSEPPLGLREVFAVASEDTGDGYSIYRFDDAQNADREDASEAP